MGNCMCLSYRAVNSTQIVGKIPPSPKLFTLDDLKAATGEFVSDYKLREGGLGTVFKGWIDGHTFAPITTETTTAIGIAVKKLILKKWPVKNLNLKKWPAEVQYLDGHDRPHLAKFIGHCSEKADRLLLVYHLMPQRSLDRHLFGTTEGRTPKIFTLREMAVVTDGYCPRYEVGKGSFGTVYKGWLDEHTFAPRTIDSATGIAIAVKRLKLTNDQGHKQWLAEVEIMKECDHPNIIKLIGHCSEDTYHLLVYEFMPRRSLDMHLFWIYDQPLSWAIRIKIALGAAKGLAYLHRKGLLFRDIKTANVLLDSEYNAKLSGFGLARDGPAGDLQEYNANLSDFGLARDGPAGEIQEYNANLSDSGLAREGPAGEIQEESQDGPAGDKSHVSSNAMRTAGYIDPNYISTGHASSKTDVYSFGVLLLEMLTGKKRLEIGDSLVQLAGQCSETRLITDNMDPNMGGTYFPQDAQGACEVVCRCLSRDIENRPTMDEVVNKLEVLHGMNADVAWNFDQRRANREGTSGSK